MLEGGFVRRPSVPPSAPQWHGASSPLRGCSAQDVAGKLHVALAVLGVQGEPQRQGAAAAPLHGKHSVEVLRAGREGHHAAALRRDPGLDGILTSPKNEVSALEVVVQVQHSTVVPPNGCWTLFDAVSIGLQEAVVRMHSMAHVVARPFLFN